MFSTGLDSLCYAAKAKSSAYSNFFASVSGISEMYRLKKNIGVTSDLWGNLLYSFLRCYHELFGNFYQSECCLLALLSHGRLLVSLAYIGALLTILCRSSDIHKNFSCLLLFFKNPLQIGVVRLRSWSVQLRLAWEPVCWTEIFSRNSSCIYFV